MEWLDISPEQTQPIPVHMTLLEEATLEPARGRTRVIAEAFAALASLGTFAAITDTVAWQRAAEELSPSEPEAQ
jgi:hypothetical protein